MTKLPQHYVEQYINQYVGYPRYHSRENRYNGCCPICREGKSWGRKKRFWYLPERDACHCFNCGYSRSSLNFIKDVSGMSYYEIIDESEEYDLIPKDITQDINGHFEKQTKYDTLPKNCINLFNANELEYYKGVKSVVLALKYIKSRNLDKAINRPDTFYMSLVDEFYRNRLIIPFYNVQHKIDWFQGRKLPDVKCHLDEVNYLSKIGSQKSLYNIDKIDQSFPYIFMFEGPIDSMFVKNGSCVAGITEKGNYIFDYNQKMQLSAFPLHKIIFILDNPENDKTSSIKTKYIVDQGYEVFKWPKYMAKYKDINEYCVDKGLYEVDPNIFVDNVRNNSLLSDVDSLLNQMGV